MNKIDVVKEHFRSALHFELNLLDPKSFNEKIQWLKLFYQDPLFTRCADKITAKDYVREKMGRDICIPTLAIYRTVDDFRIEELPNRFILKLNSGSDQMLVCTDKSTFDVKAARDMIVEWLKPETNHYFTSFEWSYKNIQAGVLAEHLLGDGGRLRDYKFFCFHGEPCCLYTTSRPGGTLHMDFYDLDWNHLPYRREYPKDPVRAPRPEGLAEMIDVAKTLSKDFAFVRVDLYCMGSQVFFGELTFYPANGIGQFTPLKTDYELGALLTLPDHALFLPDANMPPIQVPRSAINELFDLFAPLPLTVAAPIDPAIDRLRDKIERMQKSFSWRLTAPLRFLRRKFLTSSDNSALPPQTT